MVARTTSVSTVTRAQLQRQMIGAIAERFPDTEGKGLLAAFVDYAESDGDDTLRQLEALIAARLANKSTDGK